MSRPGRELFVLVFEALPDEVPVPVRLRQLLKHALRAQKLRCVRATHQPAQGPAGGAGVTAGPPDGPDAPGGTPGPLPGEAGDGVTT